MSYPFKKEKVVCKTVVTTIGEYIEKYQPGLLLDLNPITQRPPIFVAVDNKKSVEILETIMLGVSLNMITIVKNKKGEKYKW